MFPLRKDTQARPIPQMVCQRTSECPSGFVCGQSVPDTCYFCPLGERCDCLSPEESALCVAAPCDAPMRSGRDHFPCHLLDAQQCATAASCRVSPSGTCEEVPCGRLRTQSSCERAGCSWAEALQLCAPGVQVHETVSREACAALAYRGEYPCFASQMRDDASSGVCLLGSGASAGDADWQRSYCPKGYGDDGGPGGCAPLREGRGSANAA